MFPSSQSGIRFFRFLADFFIPNFNFKRCWISSERYKNTVLGRGLGVSDFLWLVSDFLMQSLVSCLVNVDFEFSYQVRIGNLLVYI